MDRPQQNLPDAVANLLPMPGHIFEQKYRVVRLIGAGGFARVFHATFEDVHRDVALKILVPQGADPGRMYDEELVQRFLREARAVSDLRSVNTITLHDFGRTRAGLLYMVFEYVDGTPLNRLIKESGPLGVARTLSILEQLLQSLREAHAVGLLHRDIKPANVMVFDYLDHRDQVRLLDFGIAKTWTHQADGTPILEDLTEDGTVMGTPRYMSPEQIVGQQLTPQSDLYSLGLVVYEMLTGAPAAPQTVKSEVARRHLSPEPFVLPPHLGLPHPVQELLGRLLAKDLRGRYSTVDQVIHDLGHVRASLSSSSSAQFNAAPVGFVASEEPTPAGGVAATGPAQVIPPSASSGWNQSPVSHQQSFPHDTQPNTVASPTYASGTELTSLHAPQGSFIQVRVSPTAFQVDIPLKPHKRALIVAAATFIPFLISFMVLGTIALLVTGAVFAWGLSLIFTTYRLRIEVHEGYEVTKSVFTREQHRRGPTGSLVRFEARGEDAEDNTVLKLITHEGEFTVANAFSEAENRWVADQGNAWIHQLRQSQQSPAGQTHPHG